MIYTDDSDVRALAAIETIPVAGIAELPLPERKDAQAEPLTTQTELLFGKPAEGPNDAEEFEEPEEPLGDDDPQDQPT